MKRIISFASLMFGMTSMINVHAADPVFTFAPPPVAYDNSDKMLRISYTSLDFGTDTLTGVGVTQTENEAPSSPNAGTNESTSTVHFLTADTINMVVGELGWRSHYQLGDSRATYFHSINTGFNFIEIDLGSHNYNHTWVIPVIATAGLQTKISMGESTVVTPYVYGLVNASSMTSETFIYPNTTNTSDSFTSTGVVFGLDVFVDGISMSAMITNSENDMVMFSVGFPIE